MENPYKQALESLDNWLGMQTKAISCKFYEDPVTSYEVERNAATAAELGAYNTIRTKVTNDILQINKMLALSLQDKK